MSHINLKRRVLLKIQQAVFWYTGLKNNNLKYQKDEFVTTYMGPP